MLSALIAGERDPAVLADLAKGRLRNKIGPLTEALQGRFSNRHAFMTREYLQRIDRLEESIKRLDEQTKAAMVDYEGAVALLSTIPGVSTTVAHVIIAETGADMSRFPTAAHLASWAGVCPGHNESAGKVKSSQVRPGNTYLKAGLGIAAMAAARSNGTYLQARYKRLAARRGPMRALVATEHSMIVSIWHMHHGRDLQRTRRRLLQPQQTRPRSSQGRRTAPPARLQSRTDNRQLTGGQASRAAQPRAPAATRTPTAAVNQVIFASDAVDGSIVFLQVKSLLVRLGPWRDHRA